MRSRRQERKYACISNNIIMLGPSLHRAVMHDRHHLIIKLIWMHRRRGAALSRVRRSACALPLPQRSTSMMRCFSGLSSMMSTAGSVGAGRARRAFRAGRRGGGSRGRAGPHAPPAMLPRVGWEGGGEQLGGRADDPNGMAHTDDSRGLPPPCARAHARTQPCHAAERATLLRWRTVPRHSEASRTLHSAQRS